MSRGVSLLRPLGEDDGAMLGAGFEVEFKSTIYLLGTVYWDRLFNRVGTSVVEAY